MVEGRRGLAMRQVIGGILLTMKVRYVGSCFLVVRLGRLMRTILFFGTDLGGLVKQLLFVLNRAFLSQAA